MHFYDLICDVLIADYLIFLPRKRNEFPITITSENAIEIAATIGLSNPTAAMGIASTL